MATIKQTDSKRKNITNPLVKLEAGKPWTFHFEVAPDVAVKLIDQKEENGAEYGKLINANLREYYGITKKKANKKHGTKSRKKAGNGPATRKGRTAAD